MKKAPPTTYDIIEAYRVDAREREEMVRLVERENRALRAELGQYLRRPDRRERIALACGAAAGTFWACAAIAWRTEGEAQFGWLMAAGGVLTLCLWRTLRVEAP